MKKYWIDCEKSHDIILKHGVLIGNSVHVTEEPPSNLLSTYLPLEASAYPSVLRFRCKQVVAICSKSMQSLAQIANIDFKSEVSL